MNLLPEIVAEVCTYLRNIHILNLISTCKYYWLNNKFLLNRVKISYDKLLLMNQNSKNRIRSLTIFTDCKSCFVETKILPQKLIYLCMDRPVEFSTWGYQQLPSTLKILKLTSMPKINIKNIKLIPNNVEHLKININEYSNVCSLLSNVKKLSLIINDRISIYYNQWLPSNITFVKYIIKEKKSVYESDTEIFLNNMSQCRSITRLFMTKIFDHLIHRIPSNIKILKIKYFQINHDIKIPNHIDEFHVENLTVCSGSKILKSKNDTKIFIKNCICHVSQK